MHVAHSLSFTSDARLDSLLLGSMAAEPFSSTCVRASRGSKLGSIVVPLWHSVSLDWLSYAGSALSNKFKTGYVFWTNGEYKNNLQSGFCIVGESKHSREEEFNSYFREKFGIKRRLSALFIDAYPDKEDEVELRANIDEVVQLRIIIEKLPPFPLEDAEVTFLTENNNLKCTNCTFALFSEWRGQCNYFECPFST